jgi:hypothetical protein
MDIEAFRPPYHDKQYLETYFLHEHPKPRDLNGDQRLYIEGYIRDFETALLTDDLSGTSRTYTDYVDLESFADFFIMNELAGNVDAYRISTFLHKPRGEKLRLGPIWDLNIGFGRQGRVPWDDWIANYNDHISADAWMVPFWWDRLLADPIFRDLVKARWTSYRSGPLSNSTIFSLVDDTEGRLVSSGAISRNYEKWRADNATVDYGNEVDFLRFYLDERLKWMDSEIQSW